MTQRKKRQKDAEQFFGFRFDAVRTRETSGDKSLLLYNHVSCSVGAGSTDFDALKSIVRSVPRPFPVKHISEKLKEVSLLRGCTYFNDLRHVIDEIAMEYPRIRWWMTAEGLVVDEVPPELESLSEFERIVGSMQTGKNISKEVLEALAHRLDSAGVVLKDHLQPKEKETIAAHNRRRGPNQIHSFFAAVNDPILVRTIRRAIYRAREKYAKAFALSGD
jgi:hypothetical protein